MTPSRFSSDLNHLGFRSHDYTSIRGYAGYWILPHGGVVSGSYRCRPKPKAMFERRKGSGVWYVTLSDNEGRHRNLRYNTIAMANMTPLEVIKRHKRNKWFSTLLDEALLFINPESINMDILRKKFTPDQLAHLEEEDILGDLM